MHTGAVQAFAVVLADRLPVGGDVVGDRAGAAEPLGAVTLQALRQIADVLRDVGRLAAQVHHHETAHDAYSNRDQSPARSVEVLGAAHVPRARQLAVSLVRPGV